MEKQIPVRLSEEEYEWLRRHAFDNKLSMAEICRRGLEIYKSQVESKVEKK